MAKIVRYDGNLKAFASEQLTNERTLFGQVAIADDLTSQVTAQFLRGWGIVGPSDQPSLQDFNAAMYTNGQLLAYLHQMGVAEYNAAQEYFVGSLTQTGGVLYISLVNANVGNTPSTSPAQWKPFSADQATEVALGLVKIATQAQTDAGADDATAITPKKLALAIQAQAHTSFNTSGTSTAQILTPTPALPAYAAKQRFNVTFNVASGANPTINISGRGPKNLKQYDSTGAKIAAVFAAGQLSDVEYDGTDFILLDQLPTLGNVGFQYSKLNFLVGATAMNATYAGSLSVCNSASAFGVTLPALSTMTAGQTITVWNFGAGLVTLSVAGADNISAPPGSTTTYPVAQGATVVLGASPATSTWYMISGPQATENTLGSARVASQTEVDNATGDSKIITPQKLKSGFAASYGVNGYIKFPSWLFGLTIQWGTVAGSNTTQSFPLAFATSCAYLGATVQIDSNSPASDGERQVSAFIVSNSQFRLRNGTANGLTLKWLALGF